MANIAERAFAFLPPSAARLAALASRPRPLAILCIAVLSGTGWFALGLMAGAQAGVEAGPWDWLEALCRPASGETGLATFFLAFAMWSAMALAMMLPSAAPMILTYAEIADTAARKGQAVVSVFALTAGYAAVWIAFALVVSALQSVLVEYATGPAASVAPGVSAVLFLAAGAYQFSGLKHACLRVCQRPFPFFFAHWRTTVRGVFGLGIYQGVYCLGCCWAIMLLMFGIGVMNAAWMAALGAIMTIEKISETPRFSRIVGVALIGAGMAIGFVGAAGTI